MVITKDRDIDLIEAIEDLESLENEKKVATGFMNFRDFDKLREQLKNVSNNCSQ